MMASGNLPSGPIRLARTVLFVISAITIFPGLASNRWGVADQSWFDGFQRDSESLVVGRLVQSQQSGVLSFGGLMGRGVSQTLPPYSGVWFQYLAYTNGLPFTGFEPYQSQPGAQGFLFAGLDMIFAGPATEQLQNYRDLTALLTALALALVVLWFCLEFGYGAAAVVLLSILASQWLVVFGRNLYWSLWSYYLPFLVSLYWLRYADTQSTRAPWAYAGVTFTAVAAMCLFTGYAFITTTVIMAAVPLIYYGWRDRWGRRRVAAMLAAAAVGSAAAMILTAVLLIVQIASVRGSLQAGVEHLLSSLAKRTYGDPANLPEIYAASLKAPVIEVVSEYLRGRFFDVNRFVTSSNAFVVRYLFKIRYIYLIGLSLGASAGIRLTGGLRSGETSAAPRRGLIAATWFSLLAPLSWFIIFKAHSYIHADMNYIVWQMPFTLFAFAAAGLAARDILAFLQRQLRPTGGLSTV